MELRETSELLARVIALIGHNPEALIARVRDLNRDHDRQKAGVDYLDEMRKVVLAEEIERQREHGGTVQQIDARARSSEPYRRHLKDTKEAKEKLADLASEYYAARNALDWAERMLSFAQSEMRLTA